MAEGVHRNTGFLDIGAPSTPRSHAFAAPSKRKSLALEMIGYQVQASYGTVGHVKYIRQVKAYLANLAVRRPILDIEAVR